MMLFLLVTQFHTPTKLNDDQELYIFLSWEFLATIED